MCAAPGAVNSLAIIRDNRPVDYSDPALKPKPAPDLTDDMLRDAGTGAITRLKQGGGRRSTFLTGTTLGDIVKPIGSTSYRGGL